MIKDNLENSTAVPGEILLPRITSIMENSKNTINMDYVFVMMPVRSLSSFPRFNMRLPHPTIPKELLIFYIEVNYLILEKIFKKLNYKKLFEELENYLLKKASLTDIKVKNTNKFDLFEDEILMDNKIKRIINQAVVFDRNYYVTDIVYYAVIPYYTGDVTTIAQWFFSQTHLLKKNQIYEIPNI